MDQGGAPGLERVSSFVLQVLPAVLSGLIGLFILAAALFDCWPDAPHRTPAQASPPTLVGGLPQPVHAEHDKARTRMLGSVGPTILAEIARR